MESFVRDGSVWYLLLRRSCLSPKSGYPLSDVYFGRESQDRRCSARSKALIDRAAQALCKRLYDLEPVPGTSICFARAVVRYSALNERQRWQQFDANRAAAVAERVTFCIRDELGHDQAQSPAAHGIHLECALHQ